MADPENSDSAARPVAPGEPGTDAPGAGVPAPVGEPGQAIGAADEVKKPPPPPPPRPPAPAGAAKAPVPPKPAAGEAKGEHKPAAAPAAPPDPPPPAGVDVPSYLTALQNALPDAVTQLSYWVGDWTVIVPVDRLEDVARRLRDAPDAAFDFCSDATASDWPARTPQRFDVIYCLYSTRHRRRVRLKTRASETDPVPSMTGVWPSVNWLEREVYDLFGVNFVKHPDRRRILMPDDWQGFPQRKDYPLEGPGELLMESPLDWLKLRQAREQADIE